MEKPAGKARSDKAETPACNVSVHTCPLGGLRPSPVLNIPVERGARAGGERAPDAVRAESRVVFRPARYCVDADFVLADA